MIYLKKYYINTTDGVDCIPITHEVKYALKDAALLKGVVTVVVPDGGAGIVIMEPISALLDGLKGMIKQWQGGRAKEMTTRDHRKREVYVVPRISAAVLGFSAQIPFAEGKLVLDPYLEILLVDADPVSHRREVAVQVMGEPMETAPPGPAPAKGGRGAPRA